MIGNGVGHHEVELDLHPSHHKWIQSNIRGGRGLRFSPDRIQGRSLLGSLKKGAMRAGDYIRKNVPKSAVQKAVNRFADRNYLGDLSRYALDKGLDIGYSIASGADFNKRDKRLTFQKTLFKRNCNVGRMNETFENGKTKRWRKD